MRKWSKNKKAIEDKQGKTASVNVKKLKDSKVNLKNIEDTAQTTNAMNIVLSSQSELENSQDKSIQSSKDLISKNYDLAKRKITANYDNIIESGSYITTPYLSIQIVLYLYEKNLKIKSVEQDVQIFLEEIWAKVAQGITVWLSPEIVIEPVVYINKILPAVTVTPDFARMVNAIQWKDLFKELKDSNRLRIHDEEVYEVLMNAIQENINQGYFIQLGEPILLKIKLGSTNNMILLSEKTLKSFNLEYRKFKSKRRKKDVITTNSVNHFEKTINKLERDKEEAA